MNQTVNIPIQLFSVTSTLGDLTPVLFKFEDAEHQIITVRIQDVLSHKEQKIAGVRERVHTCTTEFEGRLRMFALKYYIQLHRWTLFSDALLTRAEG